MPPLNNFEKTILALAMSQATVTAVKSATIDVAVDCSLANAIRSANTDSAVTSCTAGSGADIINIPTQTITLTTAAIDGAQYGDSGLPLIDSDITIQGNNSTITRNSGDDFRIMGLKSGNINAKLTINSVTISNGAAITAIGEGYGGAIYAGENTSLTINDSIISGNTSGSSGGGVYSYKATEVHISNTEISGNLSSTGTGIRTSYTPLVTLVASTISNNTATSGSGTAISMYRADTGFNISNSTISGNISPAPSTGSGIYANASKLSMTHVTMTNNSVVNSIVIGGNSGHIPVTTINNTVIANTNGGNDCAFNFQGGTFNHTNSWFFDNTCTGTAQGDPLLGVLSDNGGTTQTHLPTTNVSSLINSGNNTICNSAPINGLDQRGIMRPNGSACDIGAVENNILIFVNGFETTL